MELANLRTCIRGDDVVVEADLIADGRQRAVWYTLPERYRNYITDERYDAFLLATLPLAMRRGTDLRVSGLVSEKLFDGLATYMKILRAANTGYHEITILPDGLDDTGDRATCAKGVGCGFSGGVDSMHTVRLHTAAGIPSRMRLTHLLFNNVGSHGQKNGGDDARRLFLTRYRRLSGFAREIGLDLIKVDSNLHEVLAEVKFTETHTLRNASVVLLLQKLFAKFLYSSGLPYAEQGIKSSPMRFHDYLDSKTVHLLGTETLECSLVGADFGRIEKLAGLKDFAAAHSYLDVCTHPQTDGLKNCGRCEKCLRTLTILESNGALQRFAGVFDLEAYQRVRTRHVVKKVIGQPYDVSYQRILRDREKRNLSYSWPLRMAGQAYRIVRICDRTLRG